MEGDVAIEANAKSKAPEAEQSGSVGSLLEPPERNAALWYLDLSSAQRDPLQTQDFLNYGSTGVSCGKPLSLGRFATTAMGTWAGCQRW